MPRIEDSPLTSILPRCRHGRCSLRLLAVDVFINQRVRNSGHTLRRVRIVRSIAVVVDEATSPDSS